MCIRDSDEGVQLLVGGHRRRAFDVRAHVGSRGRGVTDRALEVPPFDEAVDERASEGVPRAGDDAGAMPEACSGDCDFRRATAEELSEGLDVFEVGVNLERKMSIPERPIVRMSTYRRSRDMALPSSPLGWPVNLSLQGRTISRQSSNFVHTICNSASIFHLTSTLIPCNRI